LTISNIVPLEILFYLLPPFFAPYTQKKPVTQAQVLDMTGFL